MNFKVSHTDESFIVHQGTTLVLSIQWPRVHLAKSCLERLCRNLVWNFFNTKNASERLASAAEFNCLDDKPNCSRIAFSTGSNDRFGINCGGKTINASNITYDGDVDELKDVQFVKSASKNWAVITTGYVGHAGFQGRLSTQYQITNTVGDELELYLTARTSPSSLRYYGLNMRNGNYNVTLHFAEISIWQNSGDWEGTGKRIFDIYIQGKKVFDKYNIMERAGQAFAVKSEMIRTCVENSVLEIHLKWSGKGTCCTPEKDTYGPLISAIHVYPTTEIGFAKSSKSNTKVVAITVPLGILLIIAGVSLWLWRWKKHLFSPKDRKDEFWSIRNKLNLYNYNDLRDATNDFHPINKLGQGGFGAVYKGILKDGTAVAIKQLSLKSSQSDFVNEVEVISSVQHRNLVNLFGYCFERDHRILVMEFLESNSLHQALLGSREQRIYIDWPTRVNICLGIARGIAYLHEETSPRIIHRDIKSSNILLDRSLNPKIADFGLAKLFKDEETDISTRVAGTIGYLAPEYAMFGELTEKVDVYSFGVLALEIVSGRNNMDRSMPPEEAYLLDHVWHLVEEDRLLDIVDEQVRKKCSEEEAKRIIKVALFCTQHNPNHRPTMSQIVTVMSKPCEVDVLGLLQEDREDNKYVFQDYKPRLTQNSSEFNSLLSSMSAMSMPSYRLSLVR